jgi:HlyD family secretion protein
MAMIERGQSRRTAASGATERAIPATTLSLATPPAPAPAPPPGPRPGLFRQVALDRLSSPEQLDLLMRVTDARGWLSLAACGLLLATALAWGFLGRIPTKVRAGGILIPTGGLADVVAVGDGQLTALEVQVGDRVRRGEAIAVVAQPELTAQIEALRKQNRELRLGLETSRQHGTEDTRLRSQASAQERLTLRTTMAAARERQRALEDRLAGEERLLAKGMLPRETVRATRLELRAVASSLEAARTEMERVAVNSFSAERANEDAVLASRRTLADGERQVQLLEQRLGQTARVLSPHDGRVVELRATVGDVVRNGMPIASLERTDQGGRLEALLYLDSREGKAVRPGMTVEVEPTVVHRERYGAMVAVVRAVEDFPSTRSGMMRALHNEQLVDALLAETAGAPVAVRAALQPAPGHPTRYRWTSGRGPDLELTGGTRLTAYVVTRSQRPVALVFPLLENSEDTSQDSDEDAER